jgi:hypothetical protein
MHLAESALNRLLNFMDELDASPIGDAAATGAAIDAALSTPTPQMPPATGVAEALVAEGLGLEPIP